MNGDRRRGAGFGLAYKLYLNIRYEPFKSMIRELTRDELVDLKRFIDDAPKDKNTKVKSQLIQARLSEIRLENRKSGRKP